jgi:membrane protein implicated in regulation of membrane protease activity
MRRLDVILIGIGLLLGSGGVYVLLQLLGVDSLDAGIWTQVIIVASLVGWLATYGFRALTKTMTYNQQLKDYEDAYLQKRLDEMSPEELTQLQNEIEQEKRKQSKPQ